jgi:hypothetical protein
MKRAGKTLVCLALVVAGTSAPAYAGSEDDPEIQTGDCDPRVVHVQGEYTVCKAWFESLGETREAEPLFRTTIQVADDIESRETPIRVGISWRRADGCRDSWRLSDTLDGAPQLHLARQCPQQDRVQTALNADRVVFDGRNVSLVLSRADFVKAGSDLRWDDRLAAPIAFTQFVLIPSNDLAEVSTLGGDTAPGRDFVLAPRTEQG